MALEQSILDELYRYYDPRTLDPAGEEAWWRNRADQTRQSAFDRMASAGVNVLGALGGFAFGNPGAQRTRTALGRHVFGNPGSRVRSAFGNVVGWGNVGLGGYQGYGAYEQSRRHQQALEMLERWRQQGGPGHQEMFDAAFAPRVPGSR